MKGDFSRSTFNERKHYSGVFMQQGRVQLDADWNEEAQIVMHYLRSLARDIIGPHGGPKDNLGFEIGISKSSSLEFTIGGGHYYVDGILCELENMVKYTAQPDYPLTEDAKRVLQDANSTYLFYLDVWERHITIVEDPSILDVALGGPDTTTRAKVLCQVKTAKLQRGSDCSNMKPNWDRLLKEWQPKNRGQIKARAKRPSVSRLAEPNITSPEACYSGSENHLYRVEVHKPGSVKAASVGVRLGASSSSRRRSDGNPQSEDLTTAGTFRERATFKWSRDNASISFPIRKVESSTLTLENMWRDDRFSLNEGDWVEVVNDDYALQNSAMDLICVERIDPGNSEVKLNIDPNLSEHWEAKHPLLRRWDQKGDANGIPIVEGTNTKFWLDLEEGVQIQFQPGGTYRTGDYWLIPARTTTGDVEWPGQVGKPSAQPPHGVEHHYAPLSIISRKGKRIEKPHDCRVAFKNLNVRL